MCTYFATWVPRVSVATYAYILPFATYIQTSDGAHFYTKCIFQTGCALASKYQY